jgi:hypothetical protein
MLITASANAENTAEPAGDDVAVEVIPIIL